MKNILLQQDKINVRHNAFWKWAHWFIKFHSAISYLEHAYMRFY